MSPFGFDFGNILFSLDVIGGYILAVFPPTEVQGMAHQMYNTGLDGCASEDAFEAVYNCDTQPFL